MSNATNPRTQLQQAATEQPTETNYRKWLAWERQHGGDEGRAYEHALAHHPESFALMYEGGRYFQRHNDILKALQYFERALAQNREHADLWLHTGTALTRVVGQMERAASCMANAAALQPDKPEPLKALAGCYTIMGNIRKARETYAQAYRLGLDDPLVQLHEKSLCPRIPESEKELKRWRRLFGKKIAATEPIDLSQHLVGIPTSNAHPPFHLAYQGESNKALRQAYAAIFAPTPTYEPARRAGKPRIAFLVTPGHEKIFWKVTGGLIKHWQSPNCELLILCQPASYNVLRELDFGEKARLQSFSECFDQALNELRALKLDVVYFWEVGTDAWNYFLALLRIARVQVTSWGSMETTGVPAMDVFLSCRQWEGPEAETDYSERLVQLPRPPIFYQRPQTISTNLPGREHFDLNAGDHLYFCPQNLMKCHPHYDRALAELLALDPAARILFVELESRFLNQQFMARLERALGPRFEAVSLLPRMAFREYLALANAADVILDPFYFTAGNTAYELFQFGLPIVTWPGPLAKGRYCAACYQQVGVAECLVTEQQDYARRAYELAVDTDQNRQIRAKIRANLEHLYEDQQAQSAFEQALIELA